MCTGGEIALIASLASTAGGTYLNAQAQTRAQEDMNNQVAANNRRLEDQYAYRQAQENAARTGIERTADEGNEQQKEYSQQKQDALRERLAQFSAEADQAARAQATSERLTTTDEIQKAFDAGPIGSGGPEVIRETRDRQVGNSTADARKVVEALAGIGAFGDAALGRARDTTSLGRFLSDIGRQAQGQQAIAHERVGNLNRSIASSAGRPYETLPVTPKSGTSTAGTILSGLGEVGTAAAFMGANPAAWFKAPAGPVKVTGTPKLLPMGM